MFIIKNMSYSFNIRDNTYTYIITYIPITHVCKEHKRFQFNANIFPCMCVHVFYLLSPFQQRPFLRTLTLPMVFDHDLLL